MNRNRAAILLFAGHGLADGATTGYGIHQYGLAFEGNPIVHELFWATRGLVEWPWIDPWTGAVLTGILAMIGVVAVASTLLWLCWAHIDVVPFGRMYVRGLIGLGAIVPLGNAWILYPEPTMVATAYATLAWLFWRWFIVE